MALLRSMWCRGVERQRRVRDLHAPQRTLLRRVVSSSWQRRGEERKTSKRGRKTSKQVRRLSINYYPHILS